MQCPCLKVILCSVRLGKYVVLYTRYLKRDTKNRGNTCCTWAGGFFFQLCCCVSFLVLVGNRFWCCSCTLSPCGILVCWFWREIVFGVTCVHSTIQLCIVSVFLLWREIVIKMRTPFDFLWAVSTKKPYWVVTLLWSASRCVYFIRPSTL